MHIRSIVTIVLAFVVAITSGCTVYSLNPVLVEEEIQAAPDLVGRWAPVQNDDGPPADVDESDVLVVLPASSNGLHKLLPGDLDKRTPDPCEGQIYLAVKPLEASFVGHVSTALPETTGNEFVQRLYLPLRIEISEDKQALSIWIISEDAMRWAAGFDDPQADVQVDSVLSGNMPPRGEAASTMDKTPIECVVVDGKLLISAQSSELRRFMSSKSNPYVIDSEIKYYRIPDENESP